MFGQSISLEASTSTSGFETDSDQVKLFVEAERLCLEVEKNYREFGSGIAIKQPIGDTTKSKRKKSAKSLSAEDYLKLRWCLEKRSNLRLQKAFLHRWTIVRKIQTEVTEIFDELTTLTDYLGKGMALDVDLKHTYLEYLPSHAKNLKVELTYWAQIHQFILHNRWLSKADCLQEFWTQTRQYTSTIAYVLSVMQQLMLGGLSMFARISNFQKLNIAIFTNDFCIATSDFNTVLKEVGCIYDTLMLSYPGDRPKLPGNVSILQILTAAAQSDAFIQAKAIMRELVIKPNISDIKHLSFRDILAKPIAPVAKTVGSSLPPIGTKSAMKRNKQVDGATSDYSSMSGSVVSDGVDSPDLESSLISPASAKTLLTRLKTFQQQRNAVLSDLLDSATKHRSIADSKVMEKLKSMGDTAKPTKKGVSWLEDTVNEQKQEILLMSTKEFWSQTAKHLDNHLTYGSIGLKLPRTTLNSSLATALVAKSIAQMLQRGIGDVCSSLQQLPTAQCLAYGWKLFDTELTELLHTKAVDKCEPIPVANGGYLSKTATFAVATRDHLDLMSSLFEDSAQFDYAYDVVDDLVQSWIKDKFIRSLSSNAFTPVILLRFCDFPKLCDDALELEKYMDSSMIDKVKSNFTEALTEVFPNKRFWSSKAKATGSEYVDYLVDSIVDPIFEPLKLLRDSQKDSYVQQMTMALYQVWVKYLFDKEYQFSQSTASLLHSDFEKLKLAIRTKAKLEGKLLDDLAVFPYLNQAISMLETVQTRRKSTGSARFSKNKIEPAVEISMNSDLIGFPSMDKWLQLRPKSHFPICSCLRP